MREYEYMLKGIEKGYRAKGYTLGDESGATYCLNLAPGAGRLEPPNKPSLVLKGELAVSWPFPQLILLNEYSIAMTKDTLYTLDTSWNATHGMSTIDTQNDLWHYADFNDYVVMTNGYQCIEYNYTTGWSELPISMSVPRFGTICNFNGQAIVGNIQTDTYSGGYLYDCEANHIMWSKIGSFDFTLDKTNVAGFRAMPWQGEVYKVLPLGKGVVVYGSGGIGALIPNEQTFGFKKLANYGIAGRNAVAGSVEGHVLLDEAGYLRRVNPDFSIQLLHFQEYLTYIAAYANPVVSHDPVSDDYYISRNNTCYVLDDDRLYRISQAISSVDTYGGDTVGTGEDFAQDSYELDDAVVISNRFDMGSRGLKTIQTVEIGCWSGNIAAVKIDARANNTSAFTLGSWRNLNNTDSVHYPCAGVEFRVGLKFTASSAAFVDYILIRFKETDKRSVRGRMRVN